MEPTEPSPVPMTRDGLAKKEAELERMLSRDVPHAIERLKASLEFGEITENAEYAGAKDEQGRVWARVEKLQREIRLAQVIEDTPRPRGKVGLGSRVKVNDDSGEATYLIVGPVDAAPGEGRISMESPVGKALMGKVKGDEVEVVTPAGTRRLSILKIS